MDALSSEVTFSGASVASSNGTFSNVAGSIPAFLVDRFILEFDFGNLFIDGRFVDTSSFTSNNSGLPDFQPLRFEGIDLELQNGGDINPSPHTVLEFVDIPSDGDVVSESSFNGALVDNIFDLFSAGTGNLDPEYNATNLSFSVVTVAVPEPSGSVCILGLTCLGLLRRGRR